MKRCFRAMMMCFGMFCALPCPYRKWDENARPMTTLFLPLVGLLIGGLWTLTAYLIQLFSVPSLAGGAVLCAFPFLITGGIHMDGYMDVVDAVRSCRSPEERRRIMKDPHVGSFAVLFAVLLIMVQFALLASCVGKAGVFTLLPVRKPEASANSAAVCRTSPKVCVGLPSGESTEPCINSCPAQCCRQSQYILHSPPSATGSQELTRQYPSGFSACPIATLPFQVVAVSVCQKGRSFSVRRKSNQKTASYRFSGVL